MMKTGGRLAEYLLVLQDNKVHYFGQFVALVVAELMSKPGTPPR